jgi:hypothetical protein
MYSAFGAANVGILMYDTLGIDDWMALNGISQSSFNYDVPKSTIGIMGARPSGQITSGPINTSVSFSKSLSIEDNTVLAHTGRSDIKIHVSTDWVTFNSTQTGINLTGGAISSFSLTAEAGSVPQLSADLIFSDNGFYAVGAAGGAIGVESAAYIPATGIQLNLGGQQGTNAIASTTFSADFNWAKEATVNDPTSGGRFMLELAAPIEYSASVEVVLEDYMIDQFSFTNPKTWELKLYSEAPALLLHTFTMNNAELVGESVNLSRDGLQTVTLQYRGVG